MNASGAWNRIIFSLPGWTLPGAKRLVFVLFKVVFYFHFPCLWECLPVGLCTYHVSESLALKLQVVASLHEDAENQAQEPCKSSKGSYPLNHLSIPLLWSLPRGKKILRSFVKPKYTKRVMYKILNKCSPVRSSLSLFPFNLPLSDMRQSIYLFLFWDKVLLYRSGTHLIAQTDF